MRIVAKCRVRVELSVALCRFKPPLVYMQLYIAFHHISLCNNLIY